MSLLSSMRPLLIAGVFLVSAPAFAQWQWIESDGRKVYSDRPPPATVPMNRILKQPGGAPVQQSTPQYSNEETQAAMRAARASADARDTADSAAASAKAEADKKAAAEKADELKAQQAEAAEAAKRKAETDRIAAARAENCRRAKESKATLDSGMRIARTNEKGERIVLDDKARAQELQNVNRVIASDCGPMPKS